MATKTGVSVADELRGNLDLGVESGADAGLDSQGHFDGQNGVPREQQARHGGPPPLHTPGSNPDVPREGSGT